MSITQHSIRPATSRRISHAGLAGIAGGLLFTAGILLEYAFDLFPPADTPAKLVYQVSVVVAMIGWIWSLWGLIAVGAASGRLGRGSLWALVAAHVVLVAGIPLAMAAGDWDNLLFPIGGIAATVLPIIPGISVARGDRLPGWRRFGLLTEAIVVFVLIFLPGEDMNWWNEAAWGLSWVVVGASLLAAPPEAKSTSGERLPDAARRLDPESPE